MYYITILKSYRYLIDLILSTYKVAFSCLLSFLVTPGDNLFFFLQPSSVAHISWPQLIPPSSNPIKLLPYLKSLPHLLLLSHVFMLSGMNLFS